jgi:serine/threonine-protein kinase RsbW
VPGEGRRTVTVPARPEALDDVHEALAALWAEVPDVVTTDRLAFETALTEVAGNIVQHARAAPGLELTVEIDVAVDRLAARVRDTGRRSTVRLDQVSLPEGLAESGRGLALAVALVDELVYRREAGVNHWLLVRHRTG